MTNIQRRLEHLVANAQRRLIADNNILPQKVAEGILVGDVLIVSEETTKHLYRHNRVIYKDINLNATAIRMANLVAKNTNPAIVDKIYRLDQEYGRWFTDSQILRTQYQKAVIAKNFEKADTLWARYCESRDKTLAAKETVTALTYF
jgi:hypothetical protein